MVLARLKGNAGRKFAACFVDNPNTNLKERYEIFREFWVPIPDYARDTIKAQDKDNIFIFKYTEQELEAKYAAQPIKKLTKREAYDLNRKEQIELLKKLGAKKIPRLEIDRVEMILKLQDKFN